jgi:Arc/MetJ-type ribon-helix-helix transcriptional regulator
MSADPVQAEENAEELQEIVRLVEALGAHTPAELAMLLKAQDLGEDARRAIEAVAALQIVEKPHLAAQLLPLLAPGRRSGEATSPDIVVADIVAQIKYSGAARKVSVSMPEDLTSAVQRRVGHGKFSQYVTEAVTRQFELDLLAELADLLAAEHGPVPEEDLAAARAAWPDDA